jgi:hypothetical protein
VHFLRHNLLVSLQCYQQHSQQLSRQCNLPINHRAPHQHSQLCNRRCNQVESRHLNLHPNHLRCPPGNLHRLQLRYQHWISQDTETC